MLKLALSFIFPAVGIVIAALAQLMTTTLWPGIRALPSVVVSIDSYIAALLVMALSFLAGGWTRRNVPTSAGAACALIVPLLWLALWVKSFLIAFGPIAWLQPLTLFALFISTAPLISVALGLTLRFPRQKRVPQAV
jgi:hypothetical protein